MKADALARRTLLFGGSAAAAVVPACFAAKTATPGSNLIANGAFGGKSGELPTGWQLQAPNVALAPGFRVASGKGGKTALMAESNGRPECFGYVRHNVRLGAGKTYRMQITLRTEGLDDLNMHLLHGVFAKGFNDGIFEYRREGGRIVGESRFPGPPKEMDAEVRLYYRFAAKGRVYWDEVRLEECDPIPPRTVTIACRQGKLPKDGVLKFWSEWLDKAAQRKVDVALLPEMFNGSKAQGAEPLDGPSGKLLSSKARKGKMYTSASFYEKRGDLVYNTAPLFDREGKLVGGYEKYYPYDPELDDGVTPGRRLPVFQTDFGKVGIMICYDSWFPEVARLLALRGAELILFPNAGYAEEIMPARAADNGAAIACSSLNCPAGIWDSSGARAGEAAPQATRFAASSISGYKFHSEDGMLIATVDLSRRFSPAWWGGPMLSAPGGRRVRRTGLGGIEEEMAREGRRWWVEAKS